jgi:D-threo-aldose 1-dehydrogenase
MKVSDTRGNARSGLNFTALSYGGAPIGNFNGVFGEAEAQDTVSQAWDQGIRYFDTAPGYGNGLSEHRLGHALRSRDREEYVLSTKVGRVLTPTLRAPSTYGQYHDIPPFVADYDYSYDGVMRGVEQSMQRMLTDHFDALFIHDCDCYTHGSAANEYFHQAIVSAFPALESLRDQKVVKAIGFGINETDLMIEAVKATDTDVCLLAGRYTLLEQEPLDELFPICQERGVGIVLGGVYNSGVLATGPIPGARFNYAPADKGVLARAGQLEEVCRRYRVDLPAVALQFAYAHPVVVSACIGARNEKQQSQNAELFEANVPTELWEDLRAANLIRPDAPTPE